MAANCGSAETAAAPMEHDRDLGTRRIQVRLAREPLYPPLRMRLDIDRWSASSTALELIPCRLVRPTADHFRAGRLLLDSLTRSVSQRPDVPRVTQSQSRRDSQPLQVNLTAGNSVSHS